MVAAYETSRYGATRQIGYDTSINSGSTWTHRGVFQPAFAPASINGAPRVVSDHYGNFYTAFLGAPNDYPNKDIAQVYVSRSQDNGATWQAVRQLTGGWEDMWIHDRPEAAVDRSASSPYRGNLYVCWSNQAGGAYSNLLFSRSTDQGQSFSAPIVFGPPLGEGTIFYNNCSIAVGIDGTVHVGWWVFGDPSGGGDLNKMRMSRSTDGGGSFQDAVDISVPNTANPPGTYCLSDDFATSQRRVLNGSLRALPQANLAADTVFPGNVYASWGSVTSGYMATLFSRSTDGGQTWPWASAPHRISDVYSKDQYLPDMATTKYCSGSSCENIIEVIWYDRRIDPNNRAFDVYDTSSTNTTADSGGATWNANARWTTVSSILPELDALPSYKNFDCARPTCVLTDSISLYGLTASVLAGWVDTRLADSGTPCASGVSISPDPDIRGGTGC
jgi:hypothetical protein